MYRTLLRFLPPRLSAIATAFWYAGLVLLIVYLSVHAQAPFRYGEL